MKNKSGVKYFFSLFFSVLAVIFTAGFVILAITLLSESKWILGVICGILALGSFIAYKSMYNVRIDARSNVEAERKRTYANLSANEKREVDKIRIANEERTISYAELKKVTKAGCADPAKALEELVGLTNIKMATRRLEAQLQFESDYQPKQKGKRRKKSKALPIRNYHMCFMGPAGTGKTTVARIMAGILHKYGRISENKCIEIDASFMKGESPDMTVRRVLRVLEYAKGGVLFIDEAYSLMYGSNAREVIAEIVKFMGDERGNTCIILAGYQADMQALIDKNEGLHSRIGYYFEFQPFNNVEMREIFRQSAAKEGFCIKEDAYEVFDRVIERKSKEKNFGHARTIQNVVQMAAEAHRYEVIQQRYSPEYTYIICARDLSNL